MDLMKMDGDTFIDNNVTMEERIIEEDPRKRQQPSRCVTVCLGLLCAVLLAANIAQLIYHASRPVENTHGELQSHDALSAERSQLGAALSNKTEKKNQLQQSYNTLTANRSDLQTRYNSLWEDKEQLQSRYNALQGETEQLHTNYINLTTSCLEIAKQFQNKMVKAAVQIRSMPCQTGWRKFNDSCYIVSTVKKNWKSSRDDCSAVGADLVVINSLIEQEFVNGLIDSFKYAWIGLSLKEGTWRWVDGTPVTSTYWMKNQPNNANGESGLWRSFAKCKFGREGME
ncbi:CD209 antigen-like [Cottoperca gobio]|uniref:CD209 antigen-like n=1 Tax=Cottoperca gobio TaxID=56716 RepID=A0A6J2QIP5_COTGO|nr:CD209 antigen-like [Cottoperca gobio]